MNVKSFNFSEMIIRIPLFVIFFWFGILKPFGLSSATQLVMDTVYWMPIFSAYVWMQIIGWYEVLIGIFFLFKRTTVIALVMLIMQMTGTFLPLVILPEVTFQNGNPFLPTLEGQYIIKNLTIIASALVIGSEGLNERLSLLYEKFKQKISRSKSN